MEDGAYQAFSHQVLFRQFIVSERCFSIHKLQVGMSLGFARSVFKGLWRLTSLGSVVGHVWWWLREPRPPAVPQAASSPGAGPGGQEGGEGAEHHLQPGTNGPIRVSQVGFVPVEPRGWE